jgi:anti-sigma factor (TIGR02949 family)
MQIGCAEVIQELSNYIDNDVAGELRNRIKEHLAGCAHCTAILDGTRNVIRLVCDERAFELPQGFSQRLLQRLEAAVETR